MDLLNDVLYVLFNVFSMLSIDFVPLFRSLGFVSSNPPTRRSSAAFSRSRRRTARALSGALGQAMPLYQAAQELFERALKKLPGPAHRTRRAEAGHASRAA